MFYTYLTWRDGKYGFGVCSQLLYKKLPTDLCGSPLQQPAITGFQDAAEYAAGASFNIPPKQGLLLFAKTV